MAKIAVVGCGAMGSVYAALMVDAGHQVHAVTLWPDHAEAMATRGLRCEGASGDRTVPIHASTTTDGIGPCDLVIIATKAFDVEAAARSCISLLGPETIVQTIQNGLGSPEIDGMEMIRFGAFAGLPKQLLQASAKIWESAGFKVALFDDIKQMVWEKLIMNVAFSGTSCSTGLTVGEILGDPDAWSVARGCAEEAIAVAKASNIRLNVGDPIEHIRKLGGKIPDARPSMLLDYTARRRCEVDAINGAIPRLGNPLGVATPTNETVVGIIKARERRMFAQQATEPTV